MNTRFWAISRFLLPKIVSLKILPDFRILAFQDPEFKILADFKILAFQDPELTILADFKILAFLNP